MRELNYTNMATTDYTLLDPAKIDAMELAKESDGFIKTPGVRRWNDRGETFAVQVLPDGHGFLVHVHETLGTKNMLGDWPWQYLGETYGFFNSALSAIGAIANDVAPSGVRPTSMQMHFAAGNEAWFSRKERVNAFHLGWLEGCRRSGAAWTGGDTPALAQVSAEHPVLDGSAVGWSPAERPPLANNVEEGDVIIGILCDGPQENGYSGIRRLVTYIPKNIREEFVRKALEPSVICIDAVMALRDAGIDPHACLTISGHGITKLMRSLKPVTYRVNKLPQRPQIFDWIQEYGKINLKDMYYSYNNGICFAIIVRANQEATALALLHQAGYRAMVIGGVEPGPRRVVVEEVGEYDEEYLKIRA